MAEKHLGVILRAGSADEMCTLIDEALMDRMVAELLQPPPELLRVDAVVYRPARVGESVDLWMSLPGEGLVRLAYVKVHP